jgi:hypothetical protein
MKTTAISLAAVIALAASVAWAKIPPPAPLTDAQKTAADEKKKKDAEAAEKTKAAEAASQDAAVKNYQGNMKKAGKPVPKPTPIVAAAPPAAPAPAAAAPAAPAKAPAKDDKAAKK